jgi:GntR family transcriptional regulator/MocR family aminotransferase
MTRPARAWPFHFSIADLERGTGRRTPITLRLVRAVTEDIRRGRLRPGDPLPGSRELSAALKVHRNTALAAYRELLAEGWLVTRPGLGTFVSSELPEERASRIDPARIGRPPPRPGFELAPPSPWLDAGFEAPPPPGTLLMLGGLPDLRLVPTTALARAYRRALRRRGALGYGDPRGPLRLRSALASMLAATRGLAVGADDVLVTRGSQMALSLLAQVLVRPGDVVAVEELGYRPAWAALQQAGARLCPLPVDENGLIVEALEAALAAGPVRAVYVTPHHQYPTTAPLSPGRRLALLSLCRRARIAVIDDDYDHEFHYEGRPLLPLCSADAAGIVMYVGTLSKVLAPGLRIGYAVAPRVVLERMAALRTSLDRQGDPTTELAVAELLEEGEAQRHVRRARRLYKARRDRCVDALGAAFGDELRFVVPSGGMALWAEVTGELPVDDWLAAAADEGVRFQPGRRFAFHPEQAGPAAQHVRIGFAALTERELDEAVRRLRRAADRVMGR